MKNIEMHFIHIEFLLLMRYFISLDKLLAEEKKINLKKIELYIGAVDYPRMQSDKFCGIKWFEKREKNFLKEFYVHVNDVYV